MGPDVSDEVVAARANAENAYRFAQRLDPFLAPHAGTVFERVAELGEGGMGVVYRVRDHRLGREAALKLIRADKIDGPALSRFRREVEITARLDHPSIPPVYEAGVTPRGEHYMLMRVIEGLPLREQIEDYQRSGWGTLHELLEIVIKVGDTVAYAHSQGIVHRDLKPANVQVGQFGEVMVLDWGLARDLEGGLSSSTSPVP